MRTREKVKMSFLGFVVPSNAKVPYFGAVCPELHLGWQFAFLFFLSKFIYLCWGYIATFTEVLTIYCS
jgi:hypothetical protein